MISNTKDIWGLKSKWSDHDRFWTDHDRKLAEVSSDFFLNLSCAHKHSRQSSYKKLRKTKGIYRKTRKPLRRREHGGRATLETFSIAFLQGTPNVKLQFHVSRFLSKLRHFS